MPVKQCQLGSKQGYKWGDQGMCYTYGDSEQSKTAAKHKAIQQGIAEITNGVKLAKEKVSFDYDGTLSTDKGKNLAKERIQRGDIVYIITARNENGNNQSLFNVAKDLGIDKQNIFFTNGKDKWETVKRLGINVHYDNNPEQIKKINENTNTKGILI